MKIRSHTSTLFACLTVLPACVLDFGPRIRGSGVAATETRQVDSFTRVHLRGAADIVAQVAPETLVEVSGDDNLLPYVVTRIEGDTLVIEMERGNNYSFERGLEVRLSAPCIKGISISGSGEVDVAGVHGEAFEARISGSGDFRAAGAVDHLEASISGSGDMRLYDLVAREAVLRISGSGDMRVHVTEDIDARVSGSGDISYRGDPRTSLEVSGSGDIRRDR